MVKTPFDGGELVSDSVAKTIAHLAPGYREWVTIEVRFAESSLLREYAEAFFSALEFEGIIANSMNSPSPEHLELYFHTLLWMRIQKVNGNSRPRSGNQPYDYFLEMPAFISAYLKQVGRASDNTLGIEFVPVIDEEFTPMDPKAMRYLSDMIRALGPKGYEMTDQFPRDLHGSWDFMTFQLIDDTIVSNQPDIHIGLAVAASLVRMEQTKSLFVPIISYGSVDAYRAMIHKLVEPRKAG